MIPAKVREPSSSGPIAGASIQRDADSPISVMVGYISALLASISRPKGMADWTCNYGAEVQRSSAQSQPKRKELIFDEVHTGKLQKGRSWYLRSTDGQTPKRKELIFDKSTDGQISEWQELIFNKDTDEQSQPIRKELMRATSVEKGKNRSSNTNDPQIIIIGPLRN